MYLIEKWQTSQCSSRFLQPAQKSAPQTYESFKRKLYIYNFEQYSSGSVLISPAQSPCASVSAQIVSSSTVTLVTAGRISTVNSVVSPSRSSSNVS